MKTPGTVYLVGAGPGDPQLITLRGLQVLARADIVLYDYLVNPAILRHLNPSAEVVCLGRHGRDSLWSPESIQERMVSEAQQGRTVVRLKSGDSLVFGRASGELDCLTRAGIAFEIVPGITAAMAAASYAGVPLTDRRLASAVAFVTGQETPDKHDAAIDYHALAEFPGTLVIYMGVTTASTWTEQLMRAGMPAERPVTLIRRCSWPNQQMIHCRLDQVTDHVTPYSKFPPPAIAIVGDVARPRPAWNWFERRPLFGQTVVITRPLDQATELYERLSELGASVLVQPAIIISAPESWQAVDQAIAKLADYDDVVFTSANGVEYFMQRLRSLGRDARALANVRLVAVGPGTAAALARFHLNADVQPTESYSAESLLDCLTQGARGRKVLLARGSRGRASLIDGLRAAGAHVDLVIVYQSVDQQQVLPEVAEQLAKSPRPWITVTSSAIAASAVRLLSDLVSPDARWVSISPLTSTALRQAGIEPACEADAATQQGLVEALLRAESGELRAES
jgi:uroporphyrinogen III methyltransferase/synthase